MMDELPQGANRVPASNEPAGDQTRRRFLYQGLTALTGVSAVAAAASPLLHLDPDDIPSLEEFLQKHYKEMTPEDKERVFERICEEVNRRHKVQAKLTEDCRTAVSSRSPKLNGDDVTDSS